MIDLTRSEQRLCEVLNGCTAELRTSDSALRQLELRIAGGWVRDKLLGKPSDDIDVAITPMNGLPFAEALAKYIEAYAVHDISDSGTPEKPTKISIARINANPDQSKHLETARMKFLGYEVDFVNLRSETYATGSRIPQMNLGTAEEDALRRDITINALFYNIHTRQVEDYTGRGVQDLERGLVRTPLHPATTFADDPLRVLRCIRFATRYGFALDQEIILAARHGDIRKGVCENVSRERIGIEVDKMLNSSRPLSALENLAHTQMHDVVFGWSMGVEDVRQGREENIQSLRSSSASYAVAGGHILHLLLHAPHTLGLSTAVSEQFSAILHDATLTRRLWMAVALLPYFGKAVREKKKEVSAPASIISNGLKLGNAERSHVDNLVQACAQLERDVRSVDKSDRVAVACALRSGHIHRPVQGTHWNASLLFALIKELAEPFYAGGCTDDALKAGEITSIVGTYNSFTQAALDMLQLPHELESRPLVDGKRILTLLQLKPGPQMQAINQLVLLWQLRYPLGSQSQCESYLLSEQQHGRIGAPDR